jgi:DNA-binding NarL/FixJ family response regulator
LREGAVASRDGAELSVRVVIADDQALVRAGFRKLLEVDPEIEVVAEAADGLEAVEAAVRLQPDVVLMDIRMPGVDGLEATRRIGDGNTLTRVLILTTFGLTEYVYEALRAGASGFLLKDSPAEELLAGVRIVARGDALLDPSITRAVIEEFSRKPPQPSDLAQTLKALTARELDVLHGLARGLSNAEIAAELVVSDGTVKTHVARILQKLDLRDRVQAVIFAYESGLVEIGMTQHDT